MKLSFFITRLWFTRLLMFAVAITVLYWCGHSLREKISRESFASVSLTGVHHAVVKYFRTQR